MFAPIHAMRYACMSWPLCAQSNFELRHHPSTEQVARQLIRGRASTVQPLLESLTALGQARLDEKGRFLMRLGPQADHGVSWYQ